MSRLPILVKLTAAFAAAMMVMMAGAATFVYLRLRADLDDRVNANLHARASAAATALLDGTDIRAVAVEDPEESFAQVLSGSAVVDTAGSATAPVLTADEVSAALAGDLVVERQVAGIDGTARILAVRHSSADGPVVIAIGQSLNDRDEALESVISSFLVGGAVALGAASLIGYGLARSALAPVEAMRLRAGRISATDDLEGLPLPAARDQIRRLAETLNEMLGRLRASSERERRFLDDASHELRTPLAVIQTDLEGALLAGGHSPAVDAALTSALEETHRLTRVADDLLVLARAGGGDVPIAGRCVVVLDLLNWAQGRFAGVASREHRGIAVDAARGLSVLADEERLRQVLTNLVDNALRHGEGDILLSAEADDARGGVSMAVTDDGPGFSESYAPRAFERLSRDDLTERGHGAGIGLAIVDAILTAHGGRATVSVGRPGTVRIWLPAAPS